MKFLKKLFGKLGAGLSALRRYVAHILTLVVIIAVLSALFSGDKGPQVPKNSLLVLSPSGVLSEYEPEVDPIDAISAELLGSAVTSESVYELIAIIEHAKEDERIKGMVLSLSNFAGGGINKIQLLSDAIADFRSSGKKVYASADYYSQSQYLLASQADEVYMNPLGSVVLEGLSTERAYYSEALEKLKIKINVFRVGDYKSAVEPYLLTGMSDAARSNLEGWLNEQWQQYLATVQRHRAINPLMTSGSLSDFMGALESANHNMAAMAVNMGLVDGLMQRHEFISYLSAEVGRDEEKHTYRHITHRNYWKTLPVSVRDVNLKAKMNESQVAVIMAVGTIVDGDGAATEIGGDRLARELRDARNNDKVKAVVLRVDSPGGSAFASEIIRQEILQLRAAGKPVIASMSSVAASGGYWISAGADKIVAAPTTITGSIGVFGLIPTFDETFASVGVYYDGVSTTELPIMSVNKPMTETLGRVIQASVDAIYEDFLDLVASARGMDRAAVHAVAQGQVWSGERALTLGLVDELGTIDLAIKRAAELAELDDYAVRWPKREKSFAETMLAELGIGQSSINLQDVDQLRHVIAPLMFLREYNDPVNVYARCMECEVR